jgi:hypothetical protein
MTPRWLVPNEASEVGLMLDSPREPNIISPGGIAIFDIQT